MSSIAAFGRARGEVGVLRVLNIHSYNECQDNKFRHWNRGQEHGFVIIAWLFTATRTRLDYVTFFSVRIASSLSIRFFRFEIINHQ